VEISGLYAEGSRILKAAEVKPEIILQCADKMQDGSSLYLVWRRIWPRLDTEGTTKQLKCK
jgi:hypothetical protein